MRSLKILFLIIMLLTLVGCTSSNTQYFLYLNDWEIIPDDHVTVGEEIAFRLSISGSSPKSGLIEIYHWVITDYEHEFITEGNALKGVKFDTPGEKRVLVYVTSNSPDLQTNIFTKNLTVEPAE